MVHQGRYRHISVPAAAAIAVISRQEIQDFGARLGAGWSADSPAVYDRRIDSADLWDGCDPAILLHVKHQALLRCYQARYVLLPTATPSGSLLARFHRHYDPADMIAIDQMRPLLERELIEPLLAAARAHAPRMDARSYAESLAPQMLQQHEAAFLGYLRGSDRRVSHYRNFLVQSSADLLAEASASALGISGEFGPTQSALFRILIDEFGNGVHEHKHSVLYRATLRDFGLCDEYNTYWSLFDTASLRLHNTIHYLFQNPRNFFLQIGFLLFAEAAYQRSTQDHCRYLQDWHSGADARYFAEHAHIDQYHARTMLDDVVKPLTHSYGAEVSCEIVAGAELTRQMFAATENHLLAVSQAFDSTAFTSNALDTVPPRVAAGRCVTPAGAARLVDRAGEIQVGAIGVLTTASAFAAFPPESIGRFVTPERCAT